MSYIIQGIYYDGTVMYEACEDDENIAISKAKNLKRDPTFEGDYTRVITSDGELVCLTKPN